MAHLREKYRGQQLSQEATDLILKSPRELKQTTLITRLLNGTAGVLNGVQIPFLIL